MKWGGRASVVVFVAEGGRRRATAPELLEWVARCIFFFGRKSQAGGFCSARFLGYLGQQPLLLVYEALRGVAVEGLHWRATWPSADPEVLGALHLSCPTA